MQKTQIVMSNLPAYIVQVLKNQYFEPAPIFLLLFYFLWSCLNNDMEHHVFRENESRVCLSLYDGYWSIHHTRQLKCGKKNSYIRDTNQFSIVIVKFHLITQVISTGSLPSCHPCNKSTRQWSCGKRKKTSTNMYLYGFVAVIIPVTRCNQSRSLIWDHMT
jgi:hypothetical protein